MLTSLPSIPWGWGITRAHSPWGRQLCNRKILLAAWLPSPPFQGSIHCPSLLPHFGELSQASKRRLLSSPFPDACLDPGRTLHSIHWVAEGRAGPGSPEGSSTECAFFCWTLVQTWADPGPSPRLHENQEQPAVSNRLWQSPRLFPCQLFQSLFSLRDVSSFKPGCCFVWTGNTTQLLLGHSKPHLLLLSGCVRATADPMRTLDYHSPHTFPPS